jgi:hypothetical protein
MGGMVEGHNEMVKEGKHGGCILCSSMKVKQTR